MSKLRITDNGHVDGIVYPLRVEKYLRINGKRGILLLETSPAYKGYIILERKKMILVHTQNDERIKRTKKKNNN